MKTLSMIALLCCVGCASTVHPTEDQVMNAQFKQMEKDADELGAKMRTVQKQEIKTPEVKPVEEPQPQPLPYYELFDENDKLL